MGEAGRSRIAGGGRIIVRIAARCRGAWRCGLLAPPSAPWQALQHLGLSACERDCRIRFDVGRQSLAGWAVWRATQAFGNEAVADGQRPLCAAAPLRIVDTLGEMPLWGRCSTTPKGLPQARCAEDWAVTIEPAPVSSAR